uniref:uncharacterized protein si:dkeyp-97a10.2 n=1 Tax=Doryrhamphus excisus TaxID=161450 RepID=UPI0025ADA1F8|nr:uncharacterized protein si:dkeyp-97a10.2 [Doryrhamphus excisus]
MGLGEKGEEERKDRNPPPLEQHEEKEENEELPFVVNAERGAAKGVQRKRKRGRSPPGPKQSWCRLEPTEDFRLLLGSTSSLPGCTLTFRTQAQRVGKLLTLGTRGDLGDEEARLKRLLPPLLPLGGESEYCKAASTGGVMDFLCWGVTALLLFSSLDAVRCVSVHISNEGPVYVIPGSALLLRARVEYGPLEAVAEVAWEREPESGAPEGRVRLAACPGGSSRCTGARANVRASVEGHESVLHLSGYGRADGGVYAVTVTDHEGATSTARCVVREYEAVHHVTVSINASHSALVCGEAWGTEPHFSWLHERAAVTPAVGAVSEDGSTLVVTKAPLCGHFTCIVSNRLGYSAATYTAAPCETGAISGTTLALICLFLLQIVGGGVAFLVWRRKRKRGGRQHERLDERL